jgi:N-acetylglucosaminyldiphosphoundecaprenol N-acetyl-beta-D-mannosaminyltransferase
MISRVRPRALTRSRPFEMSTAAPPRTESSLREGRRVEVIGCPVDALDFRQTVSRCLSLIGNGGGRQVSVNASKAVMSTRNADLSRALTTAEIASADGVSIVWASRLLGDPLPGRVNGTDLMEELMWEGHRRRLRAFILGSRPAVLQRALERIEYYFPELVVAGAHHGYFSEDEEDEVLRKINDARPDLLFLAMSSPRKETWLDRNWDRLEVGLAMGVGGSIDVLAGELPRAPLWMQRYGLEWLFRLMHEPGRLWRRYLVGNTRFAWMLLRELVRRRVPRRPTPRERSLGA